MLDIYFIPLIFIAIGLGGLFFFFYLKQKRDRLLTTGIAVEGIVYDYVPRMNNDSSNDYPVIRFVTLKQEWITQTYKISYPKFILKKGQKVEVYYNPDKPSDFILNIKADKWLLLILLVIPIFCFAWASIKLINDLNPK